MTAYDDIRAATTAAEIEHGNTLDELAEAEAANNALLAEIAELKAALAECEGGDPDPPDPPTGVALRVGACPAIGGTSGPAAAVTKWGDSMVRWFSSGGLSGSAPRPPGVTRMHASWKVIGTTVTDALVLNACRNLIAGDKVTVEHEADVKYQKDGDAALLARRLAAVEDFHERVSRLRPELDTVHVLGGWRFRPGNNSDGPDQFYARSDVLGVDLDGVNTSYYDFRQMLPKVLAFADRYADRWTCPEYGWPRQTNDPTGSGRVAAINTQTPDVIAADPEDIAWFDYNSSTSATYTLTLTNERAAWQSFVAAHRP